MHFSEALEFDIDANWKLPIESFIEPYHVFSCHPWLNDFVGMDEREPPAFEIPPPEQVDVFIAWPQGPQKSRETIALYFIGDGATSEKYSAARTCHQ
jgi:phenylpropionate dioxygenase-like ring-hydroxylating dioxygenase large terminal subunit